MDLQKIKEQVNKDMKYIKLMLISVLSAMMVSCAGTVWDLGSNPNDGEYRSPVTGRVIRSTEDGGSKQVIDAATLSYWSKIARSITGKQYSGPLQENLPEVEPVK